MTQQHSPLTLVLFDLLQRGFGDDPSAERLVQLEALVSDHDLEGEKAPAWMFEFFSRILNRRLTPRTDRYVIPCGYPHGENGLCNVLLDIDHDIKPLGLDDSGEGLTWPIPRLGIRVVVIREWGSEDSYGVIIEPL